MRPRRYRIAAAVRLAMLMPAIVLALACSGSAVAQTILQVSNPQFPLTPVGQSVTENVTLTVPSGGNSVVFTFVQLVTPSGDYSMGTITGCVVDGSTSNVDGTTCVIPVTFTPTLPGSIRSPEPIARTATLQVYDNENATIQNFGVSLIGSGTTPRAIIVPGIISDLVGNDTTPTSGFAGDNGPASGAVFNSPSNMAVDGSGNIYISDTANCVVRRIDKVSGLVTTFAGQAPSPTPICGPGFDGAGALGTMLNGNTGIAVDSAGNVYIADTGNAAVREVNPFTGTITTIAGQLNNPGYDGDGTAIAILLQAPAGIAVDGFGNVFIADAGNFIVREVSPVTGNIQTIAGVAGLQGAPSLETYGVPATSFLLGNPQRVTVDSVGNVYIADSTTTGVIQIYASNQNVNLLFAVSGIPTSLAVDAADTMHVTLTGLCGVYKLPVGTFQMVQIAGNSSCIPTGDGGSALEAGLNNPNGVVVDGTGSFYILESDGVRFVDSTGANPAPIGFGSQQVLAASDPQSVLLLNGDVPTAAGATPNPLGVYLSQPVYSPFAFVSPGTGITDCSLATSTASIPLNPAAYCALSFTFTPQNDSVYTAGTSLFELAPGSGAQITQSISLSGTGTGVPATASLLPSSAMLTAGVMGGVATQQFTLTNTGGGAPLNVSSIGFANNAVPGWSQTNNCTATLTQNQTCTILVQYAPMQVGSVSQTLDVVDNALGTPQTVSLTGAGVAPTASLAPSSLNFTAVVNESTQELFFVLTNTSSIAYLMPGGTYFPIGNGFTVNGQASTCYAATVAPGASCTVAVDFAPSAAGSVTNTLMLGDNTTGGIETATVNGTTSAPLAELSIPNLTYSNTPPGSQSAPQSALLTNAGTATLHISSMVLAGDSPNSFLLDAGTCAATLAAGASCTFQVSFAPQAYGGVTASVAVTDDSGGLAPANYVTQTLVLSGYTPAVAQQSSFSISGNVFPSTAVGNSTSQSVLVTLNSPSTVLKSIAIAPTFTEYSVNSITGCTVDGVTANPAGTVCTVGVTFTPVGVGSQHNAPMLVTTIESGASVPYFLPLSGFSTGQIGALTPGLISAFVGVPGAGVGEYGSPHYPLSGLGGQASAAVLGSFAGVALDAGNNMYIADPYYNSIYRVTPDGLINLFAGNPSTTASSPFGDGGPALSAKVSPGLLALDGSGNLYEDDGGEGLRVINAATDVIGSILTNATPCSSATDAYGDGCLAGQVAYKGALGMTFGPDGNLYFSTTNGIHTYNPQTRLVSLFAGSAGAIGGGGDGGPALGAAMTPTALTFDSNGNLLFLDGSLYVRKITPSGSNISLLAGAPGSVLRPPNAYEIGGYSDSCTTDYGFNNALYHSTGNGGPAALAVFCDLSGIGVDPANNIYVSDVSANEIRRIDSATGAIVEVSGAESSMFTDYGDQNVSYKHTYDAYNVSLDQPSTLVVDGLANVYVTDRGGNVRKINVSQSSLYYTPSYDAAANPEAAAIIGTTVGPQQVTVVNAGNAGPLTFTAPYTSPTSFGISTADYTRDVATADCLSTSAMLTPGMECPVNVDFTPTVAGNPILDTQTVNDTGGTQTIALAGYARGGAAVTLTPALLSFAGAVNVPTVAQNFTLSNNTPGAVGIGSITLAGVNPGAFGTSNNCGTSLAAGGACQISVAFIAPALGNFIAQMSVIYTTPSGNTVYSTMLLGGLVGLGGTPEGQFSFDPNQAVPGQFGDENVGTTSSVHAFPFFSTGNLPLVISGITLSGTNANQFAVVSNDCPATLAPGAKCTIYATFTPTADSPTTPFAAVLSVIDNAPDTPQQTALNGTGVGAAPNVLNINEVIDVSDGTPILTPSTPLSIAEIIDVSDGMPATTPSTILNIAENINTSDSPTLVSSLLATTTSLQYTAPSGVQQLTATVNPSAATGTVSLYDGGTLIASGPLSGGSYTYTYNFAPGVHQFYASYGGSSIYAASATGTLRVVVQTTLTVAAQSVNRNFGTSNPALGFQVSGFVNGDTAAVLSGAPVLSTTAVLNSLAGGYPIAISQGTLSAPVYYNFNFLPGTLTVNGSHAQSITFYPFPPGIPLSSGMLTLTAHSSSALAVAYQVTGPATLSGHSGLILTGIGTVTVTATQPGSDTFSAATPVTQSFEVTQ